jgi:hypothetical protein
MTALNKQLRQTIIDSVIGKGTTIPARKEALKKATEQRVRELCRDRVPEEFAKAAARLPKEWFPHNASADVPPLVCPNAILDAKGDESMLRRSWRHTVTFEPFFHPYNTRFDRPEKIHQGMDYTDRDNPVKKPEALDSWEAKLKDLIDEAWKIVNDEKTARAELASFLASVNNYKQVLEKMPELEPHLPDYVKPMPLTVPVAPILKTLGKLGFDKSKKTAK